MIGSALSGGLAIFGLLFIIGIVELYVVKKAYQSNALKQGMRDSASKSSECNQAEGRWTGSCCHEPYWETSAPVC